MGTFRSNYPMIPEGNQSTSIPHFAWFHPGSYLAATRNGFNPFQGTQHNPESKIAIPIQSMPIHEAANNVAAETESLNPTKKPKTSKKSSIDAASKEPKMKTKKGSTKSSKAKVSGLPSAKRERKNLNFASYESRMDASGFRPQFVLVQGLLGSVIDGVLGDGNLHVVRLTYRSTHCL